MKTHKSNHSLNKLNKTVKDRRKSNKTGLPPGSLVHIGRTFSETSTISLSEYSNTTLKQETVGLATLSTPAPEGTRRWIEVTGLHDTKLLEELGEILGINAMVLEDILNTEHRPKLELHDNLLFITIKALFLDENKSVAMEQLSFVLTPACLLSFHESDYPWFQAIHDRLAKPENILRQHGLDYLLYSLIDIIVDQYYTVSEAIGDKLEDLEDMIFDNPSQELIENLRQIKKDIIAIRKVILPALEGINKLNRFHPELIGKDVQRYFDDVDDHLVQILDYIDTYRELSTELKESYLSNISLRMNHVMRFLTIITTTFIPLSFIASIYGMNFVFMPELGWKYGYFAILAIMLVILVVMLVYFRKKKWI